MIKTVIKITFITLAITMVASAQEKQITKGNQQWIHYYNESKLSTKWTLLTDGGHRWKDNLKESSLYIVRMGINYKLNSNMSSTIGFAHLGFYNSNKLNRVEFRPYQEINITNKYEPISILHRFRVEERIFYNVIEGKIQSKSDFNFRFRYRFMLNIPIFELASTGTDKKLSLNVGDEIMINAGNNIIYNVFDQNRILVGPVIQFNENFAISLIYSSQFATTKFAGTYNSTDVLWIGINHKLNLLKHQNHTSETKR